MGGEGNGEGMCTRSRGKNFLPPDEAVDVFLIVWPKRPVVVVAEEEEEEEEDVVVAVLVAVVDEVVMVVAVVVARWRVRRWWPWSRSWSWWGRARMARSQGRGRGASSPSRMPGGAQQKFRFRGQKVFPLGVPWELASFKMSGIHMCPAWVGRGLRHPRGCL